MSAYPPLLVRRLSATARIPVRGSPQSAGLDLSASAGCVVPARGRHLVQTDLQIAVPEGYYGRVAPRSGLTLKKGIDVGAGVIDSDYRGPLGVILFNHTDDDFVISEGDRIAQLILEKIALAEVREVTEEKELKETSRGSGGFGSTGVSES